MLKFGSKIYTESDKFIRSHNCPCTKNFAQIWLITILSKSNVYPIGRSITSWLPRSRPSQLAPVSFCTIGMRRMLPWIYSQSWGCSSRAWSGSSSASRALRSGKWRSAGWWTRARLASPSLQYSRMWSSTWRWAPKRRLHTNYCIRFISSFKDSGISCMVHSYLSRFDLFYAYSLAYPISWVLLI